jgi:diguanylate cyclase (GGDEF)-like protein
VTFPIPADEGARMASLRELAILDTAPEQIYDDVVALAAAICQVPIAIINFVDSERQWGKALVGLESSEAPRDASFCARTIMRDEVLVVSDTRADPDWATNPQVTGDPGLRFYAGAPILDAYGHALGSVCVADRTPRELTVAQLDSLRILARQTASHLELRRSATELRRLAVHDALTGLPNRTLLFDRIHQALAQRARTDAAVGVLFCDLDGFKSVNDRFGHDAGDTVLRTVAERMVAAARAGDTVARLSGDELVVVCPALRDGADLDVVADRMRRAVASPLALGDAEITPHISTGMAIARGGDDAEALLRRADEAMYVAKRATTAAA